MTKILIILFGWLLALSSFAEPVYNHGAYASLVLGRGYNNFSASDFSSNLSGGSQNWVVAGRLAVGFTIDKYFAIETGYQKYQQRKFQNIGVADGSVDEQSYDLQTVLHLPINKSFDLIGKFGPAYVEANQRTVETGLISRHIKAWRPRYAIGMAIIMPSYPGVSFTIDYSNIAEDNTRHLPDAELYAAGFIFHF